MKTETLLAQTRRMLHQLDVRARKRLGQHFLVDGSVLKKILSAAELKPTDAVLEVGPGLGILTRELARRAGKVVAIELDDRLCSLLKQTLSSFDNVVIINEDILKMDPAQLFPSPAPYKVVANLPYYITSPVLRHFLEASAKPEIMVLMVQKEVAESIIAAPGKRSILSISVQFYGQPRIISHVPARAFYPAPEVDSAVLRIDLYPKPKVEVTDVAGFFALVRAGFAAPRKQIANSLAQGLDLSKTEATGLLEQADIAPQRRAETLTVEEWAKLWQLYSQRKERS